MIRENVQQVGISGVATQIGSCTVSLKQLACDGRLSSEPGILREFGFENAHLFRDASDGREMAKKAAEKAIQDAGLKPGEIDVLIWASARPESHIMNQDAFKDTDFMSSFRYCSGWLQNELELSGAEVMATAQQGCASMFAAARVACNMIVSEPHVRNVLCVGFDMLPPGSSREILYNVISDAACAIVLSTDCEKDNWLGYHQISKGFYWDPVASKEEIVAAYFPTSKRLIEQLLEQSDLTADQIDYVIPTGVNRNSWDILLELLQIPVERLYEAGPKFGHTIVADNFVYLERLRQDSKIPDGANMLLFTYGFGSSWCGIMLKH